MVKRYKRVVHKQKKHHITLLKWLIVLSVITLCILLSFYLIHRSKGESVGLQPEPEKTYAVQESKNQLQQFFIEQQLSWERKLQNGESLEVWKVKVPESMHLLNLHLQIKQALKPLGVYILEGHDQDIQGYLQLSVGQYDSTFFLLELTSTLEPVAVKAQVALIIDDFGDRWDGYVYEFGDFGHQITVSILPGRQHSRQIAQGLKARGCELMLHLPMEPLQGSYPDKQYLILAGMKPYYIQEIIQRCLDEIPGISGVNNHMGSRATADRTTMELVMGELAQYHLYYVDSRTTKESVAYDVAKATGIPTIRKNLFLDNEINKNKIKQRFEELIQFAQNHGTAVGIGHCHRTTLQVLQEEIPKYRKQGIQFVPVSQLID